MTDIDIAELRRLEKAATAGPWEKAYIDNNGQAIVKGEYIEICTCWHHSVGAIEREMHANASLIAAVRNALPRLLEMVERLQNDVTAMTHLDVDRVAELAALRRQLAEREAEVERLQSDNAQAWKMANKYREQGA